METTKTTIPYQPYKPDPNSDLVENRGPNAANPPGWNGWPFRDDIDIDEKGNRDGKK